MFIFRPVRLEIGIGRQPRHGTEVSIIEKENVYATLFIFIDILQYTVSYRAQNNTQLFVVNVRSKMKNIIMTFLL
jgi:hypothetical protein